MEQILYSEILSQNVINDENERQSDIEKEVTNI